ncbi:MAG: hypothetical protein GXO43_02420 [Crenarchaeota archaeon]|nr:hypothetical protein [Thermoproteota archaeon]
MLRPRVILTLFWYLAKNRTINPLLKRRSGQAMIVLVTAIFIINAVEYTQNLYSSPSLLVSMEPFLHSLGLNHVTISLIISAILIAYTIYVLFRGKPIYIPEEIYETVLSQPVDLEEYMLANILETISGPILLLPAFLGLALFGLFMTNDPLRAILFMFGSLIILSAVIIIDTLFTLVRRKTGRKRLFIVLFIGILVASVVHSLVIHGYSPILALPYMPIAYALVAPLATSIEVSQATLSLIIGYSEIIGLALIASFLARRIGIEDLSPKSFYRGKIFEGGKAKIKFGSPSEILYSYLFTGRIFNPKHLGGLIIIMAVSIIAGLAASAYFGVASQINAYFIEFFIPMMTGMALYSLSAQVIAWDLRCYWLYRVYAIDMAPVAAALISRLATYCVGAGLVMLAGLSAYFHDPSMIIITAFYVPGGVIAGAIQLMILSYMASKKQVIRETPAGIYTVEGFTAVMLEIVIIIIFMSISGLAFYLHSISVEALAIGAVISLFTAYPLHRFLRRIVGDMMTYYDILF